jgi:hypothetical protein
MKAVSSQVDLATVRSEKALRAQLESLVEERERLLSRLEVLNQKIEGWSEWHPTPELKQEAEVETVPEFQIVPEKTRTEPTVLP